MADVNARAQYAYQFFLKKGYNPAAAAGIVGNLQIESGFADDVINGTRRGDQGTAFGLAQWRHERLANLKSYAESMGREITDLDAQLGFVDHEMRTGSDAGAHKAFRALQDPAITPDRAAAAFMHNFERPNADPSINHIAKRQHFAALISGTPVDPNVDIPAPSIVPASLQNASNPGDYNVHNQGIVPFGSSVPTQNTTYKEEVAQQKVADADRAGLLEGASIAVKNNWLTLAPFQGPDSAPEDPNFKLTPERLKKLGENIPNDYLDEFEDAVSDQHAENIRSHLLSRMRDNERLANMGTTGTILSMGAALTDPAAIAATLAIGAVTEGIGGAAFMAARLGRAGRIGLGAAEATAGNLATEVPLIAADPTRDLNFDELKFSIGSGLVLGGALGAMRKNPQFEQVADRIEAIGNDLQATSMAGSVGAAKVGVDDAVSIKTQDLLQDFRDIDPKGAFLGVRFDVVGQMLASKNPMVRGLAQFFGEDAVRSKKGQVTHIAATERMQRMFRVSQANFMAGYDKAWTAYRKANGINRWKSADAQLDFKHKITDYLREENASVKATFAPEVAQAASAFKKEMDNFWKMAQEAGITRSEAGVRNYVPRYANVRKASQLIADYGYGGVRDLYKQAIIKRQPNLDDELADKFSHAIVTRMQKSATGEQNFMGSGNPGFDLDELEDDLAKFLSPSEIEKVKLSLIDNEKPDTSGTPRMKQRIGLDENFSGQLRSRHGTVEEVSISDFYIKDPMVAFSLYSRNMSGQIALAKMSIPVDGFREGIKTRADWERLKDHVRRTGQASGANTKKDIDNLDFLYSAITGTPYKGRDGSSDLETFGRMLKDYNYIRLMGQVGFAQLPEFGRVASQAGIVTMLQAVPSFRHFVNMVRAGKMTDEMADEIHGIFAPGTDYIRTSHFLDADEFGTPITEGTDTAMQKTARAVNPKLHSATRIVTTFSGMRHVNQLLQQWSSRASAVKFVKMAMFGEKPDWNRLKSFGLTEDDAKEIFAEISANARFKGGVKAASKVEALGIDNWKPDARAKFEDALFRINRQMVLENDPGQLHRWMASPVTQIVMQFRSFTIGAWSKAFLQGANMRDKQAAGGVITSALIGTMVYAMQQHLTTIGDPDRAKKLKEKMTVANLAAAGFARTSESSLLPMLIDTPVEWTTGQRIFDVRGSGLKSDVFGNPTFDLINTGKDALKGIGTAITGDDYSRPDFRNATRVTPFQNLMGPIQFFNWISSGLPKRELRD